MNEIWKPIITYAGLYIAGVYEISNLGRVRSLNRMVRVRGGALAFRSGRILKPGKDGSGYLFVGLCIGGASRYPRIHRLVAEYFLSYTGLPEVNHKDLDKNNNMVSNLEWTSGKDNSAHATAMGIYKATINSRRARKLNLKDVGNIRKLQAAGVLYRDIAPAYGISIQMVSRIIRGYNWT